jgi:exopolysaccharide biosynthesis protein
MGSNLLTSHTVMMYGKQVCIVSLIALFSSMVLPGAAQIKWINADSIYGVSNGVHVFYCNDSLDGKPFRAFYVKADIKNRRIDFTTDTTFKRRLTPQQFYEKNNQPLVVVNGTFFSFATNQNLNAVIKDGKLVAYNIHSIAGRGKDTLTYRHPLGSAIGINKKRKADVAWLFTDSAKRKPYALQWPLEYFKDSVASITLDEVDKRTSVIVKPHKGTVSHSIKKWKMKTAIGGGPVLVQEGKIKITNEEELKFAGKVIDDKHPRTAMGYSKNNELIILVVEGRNPGIAEGVTLKQEAQILLDIGCYEALNLDGGGSSCLLINGKETIKVSDKTGQRPVPAVFIIKRK